MDGYFLDGFFHVLTAMSWDDAWDYCRTMGMYLVAIESQDKLDVVYNGMFSLTGEIFMNLIDANVNVMVYSLKCP